MSNKYKILIIEDEANICNFVKTILETNGYKVLDARNHENDKVETLDLGANDYVTKPFGTEELLARVRAALRNNRMVGTDKAVIEKIQILDMVINCEARQIFIGHIEVKLTQTEYNIVELLAMHSGRVMTYSEIVKKIWGYSDSGSIKKLQVNMANIRKKLGERPGENRYIHNELGVGYRMSAENNTEEWYADDEWRYGSCCRK